MKKNGKLFKILESGLVEANSKPIHIGGQPFYSEGFVVEFTKKDGTTWIGNFLRGRTTFDAVYEYPKINRIYVFAGGRIYIINPSFTDPEKIFGDSYEKVIIAQDQQLVAYDDSNISVIETNGEFWTCENISLKDGFRDIKVEDNIVTGFDFGSVACSFGFEGLQFSLNLITKELKKESGRLRNSSQKNKIKKHWWNLL